jgi:3-oxoacyl-[acyl-carrier protein] reductase
MSATSNAWTSGSTSLASRLTDEKASHPLSNKVALVTGGSRGVGRATAIELARKGASVAISYNVNKDKAEEVVKAILDHGGKAVAFQADMSSVSAARGLVQNAVKALGKLDILVSNAGALEPTFDMTTMSEAHFDKMFTINTKGPVFLMQEASKHMNDNGRIVHLGTGLTETTIGMPIMSAYTASKAAMLPFVRGFAHSLGERGITVNTVSLGVFDTEMSAGTPDDVINQAAIKRKGTPLEAAQFIAFVVSDKAGFVSASNLSISGGLLCQ